MAVVKNSGRIASPSSGKEKKSRIETQSKKRSQPSDLDRQKEGDWNHRDLALLTPRAEEVTKKGKSEKSSTVRGRARLSS